MGKKIEGEKNSRGDTPWIFTDHGKTWVGIDYAHKMTSSYEVYHDGVGVMISSGGGDSQVYIPRDVIPMLIKALKKK